MINPASKQQQAREEVLGRIRAASHVEPLSEALIADAWEQLPRDYQRARTRTQADILALLEERLLDYDASVAHCTEGDIPIAIERMLRRRGLPRTVVPPGFPPSWLPSALSFTSAEGLDSRALDGFDAVLTGAAIGIAETGTLVLQSLPGQGTRAVTLVPDYHLCVLRTADVVETVPEAFARLAATSTLPTTFVSGPSATADIEMTRIKGVHGPRFLDILIID